MKMITNKYNFTCDKCYMLPQDPKLGRFKLVREVAGGFVEVTRLKY